MGVGLVRRMVVLLGMLVMVAGGAACDGGGAPTPGVGGRSPAAAPSPTPSTLPSPTPSTAPSATSAAIVPSAAPSQALAPTPSPTASPLPPAGFGLDVVFRDSRVLEWDGRARGSLGRAWFSFVITNSTGQPRDPECSFLIESTGPSRTVSIPWVYLRPVAAGGRLAATAILREVPLRNGKNRTPFTSRITCTGWLQRPSRAAAGSTTAAPRYLTTHWVSSHLVSYSGATGTLQIRLRVTNRGSKAVRARCWLLVAAVSGSGRYPYAKAVRVREYRPTDLRRVGAKRAAVLAFTVEGAPIQVRADGGRSWQSIGQCWVP